MNSLLGFSQELPIYNQYLLNDFLINPAIAGRDSYVPLTIMDRHQWFGVEKAPQTQIITIHGSMKNNGGGLTIFNDQNGNLMMKGIQLAYAHHIKFSKRRHIRRKNGRIWKDKPHISFGIAFTGFMFQIDGRDFKPNVNNDPLIYNTVESTYQPEINCGVYYYSSSLFLGLSAVHILQSPIKLYDRVADFNSLQRGYYFHGGMRFSLNRNFLIEPAILCRGDENIEIQTDFNVKFYYKSAFWSVISYRRNMNIDFGQNNSVKFAMNLAVYRGFNVGYAYEYILSDIQSLSNGSHQIAIGYNIGATFFNKNAYKKDNDSFRKKNKKLH